MPIFLTFHRTDFGGFLVCCYKAIQQLNGVEKNSVAISLTLNRNLTGLCGDYRLMLENKLSDVCNWARNFVVVIGDLNLDRLRPDKPEGKVLLDLESEQGFECSIIKPTRTGNESHGKFDRCINQQQTGILQTFWKLLSIAKCSCPYLRRFKAVIRFRSYKSFEPDAFKQHLLTVPWHIGQLFDDVDDQAHAWHLLINSILDDLAPVKRMRVRDNDHDVSYMTSKWKRAIRAKRKATSKHLKNKSHENWELRRKARKAEDLKTIPRDFFQNLQAVPKYKGLFKKCIGSV